MIELVCRLMNVIPFQDNPVQDNPVQDNPVVEQFRHSILTGIIKELHEKRDRIRERSRRLGLASEMLCQEPLDRVK